MKIVLILNDDNFYYPKVLHKILSDKKIEISAIFIFPEFDSKTKKLKKLNHYYKSILIMGFRFFIKYLFYYFKRFFLMNLCTNKELKSKIDIKKCADFFNIPCYKFKNVNNIDFIDSIVKISPDICFSICSQIYNQQTLNILGDLLFNIHPSLLPKHKGRFPFFYAITNNSKQGITCHKITNEIDSGKIIYQMSLENSIAKSVVDWINVYVQKIPEFLINCCLELENYKDIKQENIHKLEPYENSPTLKQILKYRINLFFEHRLH